VEFESPYPGCREPSGLLPTSPAVTGDGPYPYSTWSHRPQVRSIVLLTGRATYVPQAAVTSGIQRTLTVTWRAPLGWAPASDLGWGRRLKLHGMQEVITGLGWTGLLCPHRGGTWVGGRSHNEVVAGCTV
jgi:hypothetical protein